MDIVIGAMARFMGVKPDDLKKTFEGLPQIMLALKEQLDRIEAQNTLILNLLQKENPDGRQETR